MFLSLLCNFIFSLYFYLINLTSHYVIRCFENHPNEKRLRTQNCCLDYNDRAQSVLIELKEIFYIFSINISMLLKVLIARIISPDFCDINSIYCRIYTEDNLVVTTTITSMCLLSNQSKYSENVRLLSSHAHLISHRYSRQNISSVDYLRYLRNI